MSTELKAWHSVALRHKQLTLESLLSLTFGAWGSHISLLPRWSRDSAVGCKEGKSLALDQSLPEAWEVKQHREWWHQDLYKEPEVGLSFGISAMGRRSLRWCLYARPHERLSSRPVLGKPWSYAYFGRSP